MSARGKPWGRRVVEEAKKGKAASLAVIDKIYDTDFVIHVGGGEDIHGRENYKQLASEFYDAFPDAQITFDDRIVKGDKVITRFTWTGTHKGEYMGVAATNKKVKWWGIEIFRRAGGMIVESWAITDTWGLMQQLGAIPMAKKQK